MSGLKGIIRDDPTERRKLHFWFTRYDCLNDLSEGVYAIELFKKICVELKDNQKIEDDYFQALEQIGFSLEEVYFYSTEEFVEDESYVGGKIPVDELRKEDGIAYICSFSANEDSLDMWRYYSKGNGGYALKLNSTGFDLVNGNIICKFNFYEVIYDKKRQEEIIKELVLDSIKVFSNIDSNNKIKMSIDFVKSVMKMLQFVFKHECYSTEKEYRCVITVPKEKFKNAKNKQLEIEYRNANGLLIPYIDLTINKNNPYCLAEIKISPFLKGIASKEIVENYVKKCGFEYTLVTMSDLPVRFK